MQDIVELQQALMQRIAQAQSLEILDQLRVDILGKKGQLTEILKGVANLPVDLRPKAGQQINMAKREISACFEEKQAELSAVDLEKQLAERIDVGLPGRLNQAGSLHPVTQVKNRFQSYFAHLGFETISGPEVETDYYNFEALNIPTHHPARAMHDTFYFGDGRLLRTHTSPVQIRALASRKPPIRLIAPGRVYRCDSDMTHTPMFHQVEGLCIDDQATMASLKGILQDFLNWFFQRELPLRFRAAYFPFTEPSAEVDMACTQCIDKPVRGCRSCKFSGWLEILGCGMVHPHVLRAVGLDPQQHQGWAFGIGLDRLAMLYFGIDDLRMMFENDLNFLEQF